jgi:hypothetical protein
MCRTSSHASVLAAADTTAYRANDIVAGNGRIEAYIQML